MIRAIGIDLGTTNTVAAQMKRGEPKEIDIRGGGYIMPSAVALSRDGELLVGRNAIGRGRDIVTSFKRDMGTDKQIEFNNRTYTPMEMSALVLRQMKKDVEEKLREPVKRALITVPAWFSERAIVETREAGRLAGFFVLRTFSEPMAAALAFGLDREDTEPKTVLVYDLGGGTFDISVLMVSPGSFAALDHEGDVILGGDDFDLMIADYCREQVRSKQGLDIPDDPDTRHRVKSAAEQAKIELSDDNNAYVILPALGKEEGVSIEVALSRGQFEPKLRPWIVGPRTNDKKSTMELVYQAIKMSNLSPDTIDNILLVGGSTYIPLVRQALSQEFGEGKLLRDVNPMLCVAHGAAIETGLMHEVECPQCHHKNPRDAMECEKKECGSSLVGEEKIDCPVCFMPSPATEKKCWKCGSELRVISHPSSFKKCPNGHENSLDAATCPECGHDFEPGGIKCQNCQHVNTKVHLNEEREPVCEKCGVLLPKREEVTAKSKGIETIGGKFSVIAPKNTPYPTKKPLHNFYEIPDANAPALEITVYEGESKIAKENDWQGELMLELPPDLAEGTEVQISFNLNSNSSMVVSAKLVEPPHTEVSARIERYKVNVELLREVNELLKKAKAIAKQGKKRLSQEGQKELQGLIADVEKATKEQNPDLIKSQLPGWKERIVDYEGKIKRPPKAEGPSRVEGAIMLAKFTLAVAGNYMDSDTAKKILSLIQETENALSRGDRSEAERKSKQMEEALESLDAVMAIVYAEAFTAGKKILSPALHRQIKDTLDEFKAAHRSGDRSTAGQKLNELSLLVMKALQEIEVDGDGDGDGDGDEAEELGDIFKFIKPREIDRGLGRTP